ncbi:hypothetical protein ACLMAJ_18385 [Nocardia sp. KC 131]|uniref:hypothetical protein n=1 Tax=Nocardia arseniciresistens TaxID=3392119 RepID=UPI00398E8403
MVFTALHLMLTRPATDAHPGRDTLGDPGDQIAQIVAGFSPPKEGERNDHPDP